MMPLHATRGEGTHKGCPYGLMRAHGGGHPQGVPLPVGLNVGALHGEKGTHKGCPYGWIMWAPHGGGHPLGVPLRLMMGARTLWNPQGVPLRFMPEKGTHKGRPYQL